MKEILLITTKGCEGCNVMKHIIEQALIATKVKGIKFRDVERKAFLREDRDFYNSLKLRDFPTIIFKKDGVLTRKEVGTRPLIVVLRWIDIDFK